MRKDKVLPEQPYFICPACGKSFAVRSWYSERIFCGHYCAKAHLPDSNWCKRP